jgi:hypothetical protein
MSKWGVRIGGLLLLLMLLVVFMQMHRTLLRLQRERAAVPASR